jgi:hypothetical protein
MCHARAGNEKRVMPFREALCELTGYHGLGYGRGRILLILLKEAQP